MRRDELIKSDRLSELLLLASGVVLCTFLMLIVVAALIGKTGTP